MKGLDDERGKLFLDYIRVIKTKLPKFFVIENVAGIISDRHFKTFQEFLKVLSKAGYCVKYSVMNAADYGVPQDRIRVFIVGIRKDISVEFLFPDKLQIDKVIRKPCFGLRVEAVEVLESVFDVVVRRRVLYAIRPNFHRDCIACLRGGNVYRRECNYQCSNEMFHFYC